MMISEFNFIEFFFFFFQSFILSEGNIILVFQLGLWFGESCWRSRFQKKNFSRLSHQLIWSGVDFWRKSTFSFVIIVVWFSDKLFP